MPIKFRLFSKTCHAVEEFNWLSRSEVSHHQYINAILSRILARNLVRSNGDGVSLTTIYSLKKHSSY